MLIYRYLYEDLFKTYRYRYGAKQRRRFDIYMQNDAVKFYIFLFTTVF